MDNQSTTNIENCGISTGAGGSVTAQKIKITINPSSPGTSTAITESPFRFNIPTPTRHFKGRKKTMEDVRDYFTALSPHTTDCWERIVAIVGLGGMGKTETAYKFAAEYKELFPNVAWINAETEHSALTSFLDLGKHLGVIPADKKITDADLNLVKEVYHEIDRRDCGKVLFIFDNAIQLNSNETEFGICKYLPTDDTRHRRFPYVLITTQTSYWEREIMRFQVDALTKDESLDFFRSSFQVNEPECNEEFKKLHQILEGYPLVMTLVAAQIPYVPNKDSIYYLKRQISKYTDELEKEQNKILKEKKSRASSSTYNKTLSNVWQLALERIQEEDNGGDALELLQFMSFLHVPVRPSYVVDMLVHSSDCPHPPGNEMQYRVKELFSVLERFYTVRTLTVYREDETGFECDLGIHRLVQLAVRQQPDSSKALERVLFYFPKGRFRASVNKSAVEEALQRSQLSLWVLPYVGIIACHHDLPAACKFVEATQPVTPAAATVWRLYEERGVTTLNPNAIHVLTELIGLTKSEERLEDRRFFGDISINLLVESLDERLRATRFPDGVQELVAKLVLNVCSMGDSSCKSFECNRVREKRDAKLSSLTSMLLEAFIRENKAESKLAVDVISKICLAIFARLRYYDVDERLLPGTWNIFRRMYTTFHSDDASQSRIVELRTCLWNQGLAKELVETFGFISRCFPHLKATLLDPLVMCLMDVCMDKMDLRDKRVQQVISAFCQMIATMEVEFISKDHRDAPVFSTNFTLELCSVWAKLFIMDSDPLSHKLLLESLSHLKFLDWMERSPNFHQDKDHFFRYTFKYIPHEYLAYYFPKFIHRFSSSDVKPIKTLVYVIQRVLEDNKGPGTGIWNLATMLNMSKRPQLAPHPNEAIVSTEISKATLALYYASIRQ